MDLKKSQSSQSQQSKNNQKQNSQYSIPDPAQKNMDELIVSIREKLQQILRQA